MSGRILVVDDLAMNRRLMEAMLARDYYDVSFADGGEAAIAKALTDPPELVLLDVQMPCKNGLDVCRELKAHALTCHVPIILITANGDRQARLDGLLAGADDFLTKPVDSLQLSARARSLIRLKRSADELRRRVADGQRLGLSGEGHRMIFGQPSLVVLDDPTDMARALGTSLEASFRVSYADAAQLGAKAADYPDLMLVPLGAKGCDPLAVVAKMQARDASRDVQILCVAGPDEAILANRALDLGAHDVLTAPVDTEELQARTGTLLRRKRQVETLRMQVEDSFEQAVTDPLTGLYNRRYLLSQLQPLLKRAELGGPALAVLVFDLDHFKRVNDRFGHDVGDDVLREFAARIASNVRPTDFVCRLGGEEFVVVMPNTTNDYAVLAAERLRMVISGEDFGVRRGGVWLRVTVSVGLACSENAAFAPDQLLKQADQALYRAKQSGRDRVACAA